MNPKKWGRKFWFLMHTICLDYPDHPSQEDKEHYRTFYEYLKYVLSCETCSNNYKNHLLELPLSDDVMSSRKNLFLWSVNMHNKVNRATGKKELSASDVLKKYSETFGTRFKL